VYWKVFAKHSIQICFIAFDELEAVKKYVERPKPHVLLMDYRLPIMNGIEATREILKIDSDAMDRVFERGYQRKAGSMQTGTPS